MSDPATYLDTFPSWLKSLGDDVQAVAATLRDAGLPEGARRYAAGSVNYLFKSLDLIPDGIEDIGFLDDAFVLRVSAAQAVAGGVGEGAGAAVLKRLAADADLLRAFLGDDYKRLEAYTKSLSKGASRGRTVDDILADNAVRDALISEVSGWAESYQVPTFARDDKTLVKLKGFLDSKLPKLGTPAAIPAAARPGSRAWRGMALDAALRAARGALQRRRARHLAPGSRAMARAPVGADPRSVTAGPGAPTSSARARGFG